MTSLAVLAYLVAAVCFIMALRGLSSPVTSRTGNLYGMVGMAIAVATTLILVPQVRNYWLIVPAIAIGGGIGYVVAQRIQMTA
ncbi:NAD(P)(+) transhydrogenase (Re/Si-specific) subunit beta, partial [Inquilinus sp. CA228]|uniref:NAD(P)(+) transhydrogenase (Re/Si-specific) subunit beta n=1 Tax=Inquilinus sp. CA228 TaxID=3455609 RepID=UPI003F8D0F78